MPHRFCEPDQWRIYYGDVVRGVNGLWSGGSMFTHEDGTWLDAPHNDVQLVAWPNVNVGHDVAFGAAYFIIAPGSDADDPDGWHSAAGLPHSVDWAGLTDYLIGTPYEDMPLKEVRRSELAEIGVKFGRYMSDEAWSALYRQIKDDGLEMSAMFPSRAPRRVAQML